MAGWSSLPGDLINRVADRLLAADDLDYYMDFRAVCRSWRASTADPKASPFDPRFQPRQWVMLDGVHQTDDARLFVNAGTGRFLRRDLAPLLRRGYSLVAGAVGGLLVLAERAAPHAARFLNPFTGSLVRFAAPVPSEMEVVAHVISSSPPTLVLVYDESGAIYWAADPDSESFVAYKQEKHYHNLMVKQALIGGIYAAAREHGSFPSLLVTEANKILGLIPELFIEYLSNNEAQAENRCFLVESAGEMLMVFKVNRRVEVFKIDTGSNLLEPVKNIGSRALFVGDCRCLAVDAEKFPSVEANCVYYVVVEEPWCDICVCSLKDEKEVRAGRAIDSFNPFTLSPEVFAPFTVIQLLCSYTFELGRSGLEWEKKFAALSALDRDLILARHKEFLDYDYCES